MWIWMTLLEKKEKNLNGFNLLCKFNKLQWPYEDLTPKFLDNSTISFKGSYTCVYNNRFDSVMLEYSQVNMWLKVYCYIYF